MKEWVLHPIQGVGELDIQLSDSFPRVQGDLDMVCAFVCGLSSNMMYRLLTQNMFLLPEIHKISDCGHVQCINMFDNNLHQHNCKHQPNTSKLCKRLETDAHTFHAVRIQWSRMACGVCHELGGANAQQLHVEGHQS